MSIGAILVSLRSFLDDPEPHDGVAPNSEAASLFLSDRRAFNRKVYKTVEKSLEQDFGGYE